METVQDVAETQVKKERKEAEDAAGLLEKLSVVDSKTDGKEKEQALVEEKGQSEAAGEKAKSDAKKEDEPASS